MQIFRADKSETQKIGLIICILANTLNNVEGQQWHTFNPSTQEPGTGNSLWVRDQTWPKESSRTGLLHRETLSEDQINKQTNKQKIKFETYLSLWAIDLGNARGSNYVEVQ